jgi:hypothetical protein
MMLKMGWNMRLFRMSLWGRTMSCIFLVNEDVK